MLHMQMDICWNNMVYKPAVSCTRQDSAQITTEGGLDKDMMVQKYNMMSAPEKLPRNKGRCSLLYQSIALTAKGSREKGKQSWQTGSLR